MIKETISFERIVLDPDAETMIWCKINPEDSSYINRLRYAVPLTDRAIEYIRHPHQGDLVGDIDTLLYYNNFVVIVHGAVVNTAASVISLKLSYVTSTLEGKLHDLPLSLRQYSATRPNRCVSKFHERKGRISLYRDKDTQKIVLSIHEAYSFAIGEFLSLVNTTKGVVISGTEYQGLASMTANDK